MAKNVGSAMGKYPFKYVEPDKETNEIIKRDFKGYTRGILRTKPFNLIMPPEFQNYGEKIYNMEVRPYDVWIVTYPKTGTTWTQAAIWSVLNEGKLELLNDIPLLQNWRFIETEAVARDGIDRLVAENVLSEELLPLINESIKEFQTAVDDPRDKQRLIKTHLPFPFLPPRLLDTAKVVYVVRNPKDTCVSWYHHHKLLKVHEYEGDFETFFDYFIRDLTIWSPYWPHVIDAWNRRHHPNMLFLFYEDMKKDLPAALRRLATFLEKPLSEEIFDKLATELSIEGMKRNPGLNAEEWKSIGVMNNGHFVRKGIVGDWKNYFTPEMERRMEEWSRKQRQGCDIRFPGEKAPKANL